MAQANSGDDAPRRILVVDDDPQTAGLVRDWFRGKPYEIHHAPNGNAALRLVSGVHPDVILLDLKMPGLDGISVAQRLKENQATRDIPVILLTACRNVNAKVDAFNAGADDYITKPFEVEEVEARIVSILRKRGMMLGLQSEVRNLTTNNIELEKALIVDEKTGLFNFREFQRKLQEEWQRAERYATPLSLVFLDLDFFKRVNDTLGHPAGDEVLREFAMLVTGGARANDVAARYGGEEFALILPHTDATMGRRVAERIVAAVSEFVFLAEQTPARITVSAGVATYPCASGIRSVDELVRAADVALYRAKDAGRNRVALYHVESENGVKP